MRTQVEERFSEFFEKWVCQLEQLQQQLLKLSEETLQTEAELQALVSKVTNLHKEYYTVKWAAAREDVLAFFCPVWSSPLENAYNWVTGWKPSMLFQLIGSLRKTRLAQDIEGCFGCAEPIAVCGVLGCYLHGSDQAKAMGEEKM
ncbi:transcription factor TGA5 [Prunus yedoensis var. nudiflora]|uniref:Transcription factor TGA5 n=1 Tax=Prunus yedoensis var. nudiflora TaxID=2094558 RepID=A0A314ZAK1_PRUYE|nr:transcription factor TGA5 [Prunus yedoensis var. nudiflora]